ncbi:protein ABHD11-like [Diaphorina citri]|uniref:Protein ABHD11-like n=1 Tax=Diaphorina citri TaxID=121845 RepID=A0A1S3D0Z3_DIACI|nr:protein ABHD11-like [Diaphorina citri]
MYISSLRDCRIYRSGNSGIITMIPLIQVGLFRNCLKCKLIISSRLCQQLSQQNDRITPIKMSFKVADTETPVDPDTKPIIIMHGLLGSKNNWNSLAKAIHRKTKKKGG